MSSSAADPNEEMAQAATLPQADASSLVDAARLETEVKDMYRRVAREEEAELHFEVGKPLAFNLGYPADGLGAVPAGALACLAGACFSFDLPSLSPAAGVRA